MSEDETTRSMSVIETADKDRNILIESLTTGIADLEKVLRKEKNKEAAGRYEAKLVEMRNRLEELGGSDVIGQ